MINVYKLSLSNFQFLAFLTEGEMSSASLREAIDWNRSLPAFYQQVHRLSRGGLIAERYQNGPRKRTSIYSLTTDGRLALERFIKIVHNLSPQRLTP